MGRRPKTPTPDGYLFCTRGEQNPDGTYKGHWAHIEDFYMIKGSIKWEVWNKDHTAKAWYGKPSNSWCGACMRAKYHESRAATRTVPEGMRDWDHLSPEEQAAEVKRLREWGRDSEPEPVVRLGPPELPSSDDGPREDVRSWISDEALAAINRDAQAHREEEDSDYEYPEDPDARLADALRRLQGGIITEEEFDRIISDTSSG